MLLVVHLLPQRPVVVVEKRDGGLLPQGLVDGVDGVIQAGMGGFAGGGQQTAAKLDALRAAGEPGELFDELFRLLLGEDGAGVDGVHQQLQFRQLKGASRQKIPAVPSQVGADNVHAVILQDFQVAVQGFSLRLDALRLQCLLQLQNGHGVFLIGLLPEKPCQIQQPPFADIFIHPKPSAFF